MNDTNSEKRKEINKETADILTGEDIEIIHTQVRFDSLK